MGKGIQRKLQEIEDRIKESGKKLEKLGSASV
jgi:hypothetical protein